MLTSYRAGSSPSKPAPLPGAHPSPKSGRLARVSEILHGIAPQALGYREDILRLGQFMMPLHPAGRPLHAYLAEDTEKALLMEKFAIGY